MKAFKITETGNFMTKLLSGRSFDSFLLEEASLSMQVTWVLDGKINRNFYSNEEWEDESSHPYPLIAWADVRSHMRELISPAHRTHRSNGTEYPLRRFGSRPGDGHCPPKLYA